KPLGRHPMLGKGGGGGEIGRLRAQGRIDADLHRVALAAAQTLRKVPPRAAPGKRKAHDRAGRRAIVEPGGVAEGARAEVVAAGKRRIAVGGARAPEARAPRAPAPLEGKRRRWGLSKGCR